MNLIKKFLNLTQCAIVGVALCFLVVPYAIEVSAELELPGPDPKPIPPIPIPPPIDDEGPWIEYGKCTVDYTENIFGRIIWELILLFWPTTDLAMEHHDAYTTAFLTPEAVSDRDEYQARGFTPWLVMHGIGYQN